MRGLYHENPLAGIGRISIVLKMSMFACFKGLLCYTVNHYCHGDSAGAAIFRKHGAKELDSLSQQHVTLL